MAAAFFTFESVFVVVLLVFTVAVGCLGASFASFAFGADEAASGWDMNPTTQQVIAAHSHTYFSINIGGPSRVACRVFGMAIS